METMSEKTAISYVKAYKRVLEGLLDAKNQEHSIAKHILKTDFVDVHGQSISWHNNISKVLKSYRGYCKVANKLCDEALNGKFGATVLALQLYGIFLCGFKSPSKNDPYGRESLITKIEGWNRTGTNEIEGKEMAIVEIIESLLGIDWKEAERAKADIVNLFDFIDV